MNRTSLISAIRSHEKHCLRIHSSSFAVAAVLELADGILAVREADNEHAIYFDKSRYLMDPNCAFSDLGTIISNFTPGVGFIEDVRAKSWDAIRKTAKICLVTRAGKEPTWKKDTVLIDY
jgi:hypothetical protein